MIFSIVLLPFSISFDTGLLLNGRARPSSFGPSNCSEWPPFYFWAKLYGCLIKKMEPSKNCNVDPKKKYNGPKQRITPPKKPKYHLAKKKNEIPVKAAVLSKGARHLTIIFWLIWTIICPPNLLFADFYIYICPIMLSKLWLPRKRRAKSGLIKKLYLFPLKKVTNVCCFMVLA